MRTMQSLEGIREVASVSAAAVPIKKRDVLSAISRPAPEPPRPRSADSALVSVEMKEKEVQRRSWAAERMLKEVEEIVEVEEASGELAWSAAVTDYELTI